MTAITLHEPKPASIGLAPTGSRPMSSLVTVLAPPRLSPLPPLLPSMVVVAAGDLPPEPNAAGDSCGEMSCTCTQGGRTKGQPTGCM